MRRVLLLGLGAAVAVAVVAAAVWRLGSDEPVEIDGYRVEELGRRVVVELQVPSAPCDGDLTVTWRTSPQQVTVSASLGEVRAPEDGVCPLAARVVEASLLLPEPLGDRPVVDDTTDEELRQLPRPR